MWRSPFGPSPSGYPPTDFSPVTVQRGCGFRVAFLHGDRWKTLTTSSIANPKIFSKHEN
uniref:Uncharacterized protein n=1 Tax=Physcomitrium patens TaxID=3218 RepID=A0A2K1JXS4_PHYPA|nr:hypothetical protein PHYPA_013450 [Physcomitrium patens]